MKRFEKPLYRHFLLFFFFYFQREKERDGDRDRQRHTYTTMKVHTRVLFRSAFNSEISSSRSKSCSLAWFNSFVTVANSCKDKIMTNYWKRPKPMYFYDYYCKIIPHEMISLLGHLKTN